jgi:outer membrane protein assembly factor BamB
MPVRAAMTVATLVLLVLPTVAPAATSVAIDASPTWGTDNSDSTGPGRVRAIVEVGNVVYVGGNFKALVPPDAQNTQPRQRRNHLTALDVATGMPTAWNPTADGAVRALALSPDRRRLYVGGEFLHLFGQEAAGLASIELETGTLDPAFRPGSVGKVEALAVANGRLYVGGAFTAVVVPEGQPGSGTHDRPRLAALDAATGALLDWNPPSMKGGAYTGQTGVPDDAVAPEVTALAVTSDGDLLHAGGTFLDFGGHAGLVSLDGATGRPADWQPAAIKRPVFGLTPSVDGRTFYGATGGAGGRIYHFDPEGDTKPVWYKQVDGDAMAVAVSATTAYLAGHYDFIVPDKSDCYRHCPEGTERRHLAAFDALTGALDPWNPVADTNTGPYTAAAGANHVYVGGEFKNINGRRQPGFAAFPGTP